MVQSFEYPYGAKVWLFKDGEEVEGDHIHPDEEIKERLREGAVWVQMKRWIGSTTVVVEALTTERGPFEAINNALFDTVAKLSQ